MSNTPRKFITTLYIIGSNKYRDEEVEELLPRLKFLRIRLVLINYKDKCELAIRDFTACEEPVEFKIPALRKFAWLLTALWWILCDDTAKGCGHARVFITDHDGAKFFEYDLRECGWILPCPRKQDPFVAETRWLVKNFKVDALLDGSPNASTCRKWTQSISGDRGVSHLRKRNKLHFQEDFSWSALISRFSARKIVTYDGSEKCYYYSMLLANETGGFKTTCVFDILILLFQEYNARVDKIKPVSCNKVGNRLVLITESELGVFPTRDLSIADTYKDWRLLDRESLKALIFFWVEHYVSKPLNPDSSLLTRCSVNLEDFFRQVVADPEASDLLASVLENFPTAVSETLAAMLFESYRKTPPVGGELADLPNPPPTQTIFFFTREFTVVSGKAYSRFLFKSDGEELLINTEKMFNLKIVDDGAASCKTYMRKIFTFKFRHDEPTYEKMLIFALEHCTSDIEFLKRVACEYLEGRFEKPARFLFNFSNARTWPMNAATLALQCPLRFFTEQEVAVFRFLVKLRKICTKSLERIVVTKVMPPFSDNQLHPDSKVSCNTCDRWFPRNLCFDSRCVMCRFGYTLKTGGVASDDPNFSYLRCCSDCYTVYGSMRFPTDPATSRCHACTSGTPDPNIRKCQTCWQKFAWDSPAIAPWRCPGCAEDPLHYFCPSEQRVANLFRHNPGAFARWFGISDEFFVELIRSDFDVSIFRTFFDDRGEKVDLSLVMRPAGPKEPLGPIFAFGSFIRDATVSGSKIEDEFADCL